MAILKSTRDSASVNEPGLVSLATLQEALEGLSSSKAMTPAGTKAVIEQLVGNAPELLDTLQELSDAINNDENFAVTIQTTLTDLQNQINTLSGGDLSGLQGEINDTQLGAGLEADGSYSPDAGSNYISSATSLKDADSKLDAQIKANADAISTLGNGNLTAITTEINEIETSVGLEIDGSFTAQSGNYISGASSVRGEISALDTQVKTNADAIASLGSGNIANLQSELDATQASVGLNTDGTYSAHSGSNYMDSNTSVKAALSSLDLQIKTNEDAIALKADATSLTPLSTRITAAEGEIDTLQAEMDSAEASIATNSADIVSINNAISAHEVEHNATVAEVNAIEASVGLNVDGTYSAPTGTNYLGGSTSVRNEITKLDTQVKSNADSVATKAEQSDLDTLTGRVTAVELEADAIAGINTRLGTAEGEIDTLQAEMDAVEASVATNTASIATNTSDIATNSGNISTLQSDLDALEAEVATHIGDTPSNDEINEIEASVGLNTDGTFTANAGGNYISGATTVRGEINALDSQLKSTQDDLDTAEVSIAANASAISGKADSATVTALQAELDASQAAVGLNANGTYSAHVDSNYIDSASTTKAALGLLDAQVKTNEDDISNLEATVSTLTAGSGATSAEIAALQGEVDVTQAGAGLSATGAYTAPGASNYLSAASSLKDADNKLDAQIKSNADAIALKASSADVVALSARVTTAEGDIDSLEIDVGAIQSDVSDNAAAIATNTSAISGLQASKANDADLTALEAVVDTHETSIGLSLSGAYLTRSGSNYLDSATSIRGEITLLDGQVKSNADAIAANDSDIAILQSDIASLASSATITAMQAEIDAIESGVGLNSDGSYTPLSGNYVNSATIKGSISQLDARAKVNADAIAANDSDIASLDSRLTSDEAALTSLGNEVDTIETSVGLTISGGYQAPASSNYLGASTSVRNALGLLDSRAKTNADAIVTEASNRAAAIAVVDGEIADLQSELDATQAGAGLGSDGSYSPNTGANYIASVSSLKGADNALDAQIKANADAIASNDSDISALQSSVATKASSASVTALQSELDASQAGVGLAGDGSYVSPVGHNYLGQATLKADLGALDAQVKVNDDDIASNASDIASLEALADTHEASIGLSAAGAYVGRSGSNYLDSATSVVGEATLLDAQIKVNENAIATKASSASVTALQSEVNSIESAVGLDTDGTFVSFSGQNYINSATSLKGGMELLDAAVKSRQDNIDSEAATRLSNDNALAAQIDVVEASVGLQGNGSLSITGTNFLDSASSVVNGLEILDTNVNFTSQVQANIRASVGLQTDGTKAAYSSTNYISGSLKAAIEALDAQVKSNEDAIDGLGGSDIANLQTELDATQAAGGLAADGSYVAHSGSNYMDGASTMKGARELLDAQVKVNADAVATKAESTDLDALEVRVAKLEIGNGGVLLDHGVDDAVEMDGTLSEFRSHSGPFQINFASLVSSGSSDLVFFGSKGERDGDRHFAIDSSNGDAVFAGKFA